MVRRTGKNSFLRNNGVGAFTDIIQSAGFHELNTIVSLGGLSADINKDVV